MSKIAITADIHFGVPGRLRDTLWACRVIREYCRMADIDTIIVLGDLYHNRQSIEIDVNASVCQFFEETNDQRWITFPGNHDMFLRHSWSINSLIPLRKHVTVIDGVKLLQLDERRFWVLPFITYERAYLRALDAIVRNKEFQDGDSLFTHIGVRGAILNTCFLLKDWSIVDFERYPFHRVYTGHFHSKQQIGEKVWYPGSPIPFKFDEGDIPHGFYVYDLAVDSHKFVNIWKAGQKFFPDEAPPPQFMTITEDMLDDSELSVENCMVRIALQRDVTSDEKAKIKKKILDMGAQAVRWMNLKQTQETKFEETNEKPVAHGDLFRTWLEKDAKGRKGLDDRVLARVNDEVVHEGDELYTIEEVEG